LSTAAAYTLFFKAQVKIAGRSNSLKLLTMDTEFKTIFRFLESETQITKYLHIIIHKLKGNSRKDRVWTTAR